MSEFATTLDPNKVTVFEHTYLGFINKVRDTGLVTTDDIIDIIKLMQKNEMDCHVVIAGQNGVGKSILLLAILKKYLGPKWFDNLMLARHTINDMVQFVLHNKNTLCAVDEWNQYLNYTRHMESDQKHFITTLELARSKSIGYARLPDSVDIAKAAPHPRGGGPLRSKS